MKTSLYVFFVFVVFLVPVVSVVSVVSLFLLRDHAKSETSEAFGSCCSIAICVMPCYVIPFDLIKIIFEFMSYFVMFMLWHCYVM